MLDRIREARRNESGFTLIELLIVIVILGVLAGIVVFAVSAFNNDGVSASCKSECKADKKNVEIALEAYYAKTGNTPASGGYTALIASPGNYLKEAPSSTHYAFTWDTNRNVTAAAGSADGPPTGC